MGIAYDSSRADRNYRAGVSGVGSHSMQVRGPGHIDSNSARSDPFGIVQLYLVTVLVRPSTQSTFPTQIRMVGAQLWHRAARLSSIRAAMPSKKLLICSVLHRWAGVPQSNCWPLERTRADF